MVQEWKVFLHDDFEPEFATFSQDVQDELLAAARTIKTLGPAAGRPHVGTLDNPDHPNMKELRFKANNGAEIWRAAFAFGPDRHAILLAARDKQGVEEQQFYKNLLAVANKRFNAHLVDLEKAAKAERAKTATKPARKPRVGKKGS